LIEYPRAVISSIAGTPASFAGIFGRQRRIDLDRDVPVAASGPFPDGPQHVACRGDIVHCQGVEDTEGIAGAVRNLRVVGRFGREIAS
jgi:hypothetical protein